MTPYYYVREIEKILIALMDVFNNLRVKRYKDMSRTDSDRTIAVPIVTHSSSNFANYVASTQTQEEPMPVPIIGFRFTGNAHDPANMVQPCYAREILSPSMQKFIRDIQPTPQVFKFEMTVLTSNLSDYYQLKENIEAYFNMYRTVRIKEFDFAPEIERQIPFSLTWTDAIDDEKSSDSKEYQYYKVTYSIEAHGVYHRPYEIPAIIKYAQMNFNVNDELMNSLQVFVYPDEVAQQKKHLWETVEPSIREGWSLLKTFTRTLVRKTDDGGEEYWQDETLKHYDLTYTEATELNKVGKEVAGYNPILRGYKTDENGNYLKDKDGDLIPLYDWEELVVGDVNRPVEVPSFDLLHLNFDEDSPYEHDFSGLSRDFVAINPASREFIPDMAPGNGNYTPDGYSSSNTKWSQILNWFGDNKDGKIESSYTFKATVQFIRPNVDTVFQYLFNPNEETLSDGTVIPAESVWFDWGIQNNRLYFTYHTTTQYRRFVSAKVDFDDKTIYSIYFVLYNEGANGAFGIRTNFSKTMIALETKEVK